MEGDGSMQQRDLGYTQISSLKSAGGGVNNDNAMFGDKDESDGNYDG